MTASPPRDPQGETPRPRAEAAPPSRPALFREEALEHHRGAKEHGDVLRLPPEWTRRAYPLVLAAVGAALVLLVFGHVSRWATGPAIVRLTSREDLVATTAGTVAELAAVPGQAVRAGEVLMRLHDTAERAAHARALGEFEGQLAARLLDPSDDAAGRGLVTWRGELHAAAARLAERQIVAPRDGVVRDVRVRPGHPLDAGDVVLSLAPIEARYEIIALLPGHARPELAPGGTLVVELQGQGQARVRVSVTHVGDQVVGPAEALRFLGPDQSDALQVDGPVVIVRADLPVAFPAMNGPVPLHDGMPARAEARLARERLLFALVPSLGRAIEASP